MGLLLRLGLLVFNSPVAEAAKKASESRHDNDYGKNYKDCTEGAVGMVGRRRLGGGGVGINQTRLLLFRHVDEVWKLDCEKLRKMIRGLGIGDWYYYYGGGALSGGEGRDFGFTQRRSNNVAYGRGLCIGFRFGDRKEVKKGPTFFS